MRLELESEGIMLLYVWPSHLRICAHDIDLETLYVLLGFF